MKYYHAHEQEYRRRLGDGQVAWDKGEYEVFDMLPLVQKLLAESTFGSPRPRALDLGCGTGALAVFLAGRGWDVTAVDVSPTAIEEARRQAASRNAQVEFEVADVFQLGLADESFDLVTDNHFLHCVVFDEERQSLLSRIHALLKSSGQYWIETMVGHPQMQPRPFWNLDADGISWLSVDKDTQVDGCVMKNGKMWFPVRRIRSSGQVLADELRNAGLQILWQEIVPPKDENDTGTFRARCGK